jgi:DNA modification methylase
MIDIRCGDAFELIKTVGDRSIDLILTDPPYDAATEYMDRLTDEQKKTMAKEFKRVLNDHGNIALFCGYIDKWKWFNILSEHFDHKRELIWVHRESSHGILRVTEQARTFIIAHETILIFGRKNSYFNNVGVVPLTWIEHPAFSGKRRTAEGNPKEKMNVTPKPTKIAEMLVERLCPKGGTVLDPFMGYGTFGIAAIRNSCNYIGFEIRPEIYEIAKKRIEKYSKAQRRMYEYV